MKYQVQTSSGDTIEFTDTKRYWWILSLSVPLVPIAAIWLYFAAGQNQWVTLLPVLYYYAAVPLLDALLGKDEDNPPQEVLELMMRDNYYRVLLHLSIPLFWLALFVTAWFVGTQNLDWWAFLAITIGAGYSSGTAITVGHELGHKTNRIDQIGAFWANAVTGYAHFRTEHNRGHHTHVATPEDPASARFNETLYSFALREIPGAFRGGIAYERDRLQRKGLSFWSIKNEILLGFAAKLAIDLTLIALFGLILVPFLLLHNLIGWLALTEANYIEHYGLKRQRMANGKYEPCKPHHSWNTNHRFSNFMLFHLQRHSDHHANPMRPYQSLRNFDELPSLPSGYPGTFLLAAIPPLWFAVMNPKVLAWAGGDESKLNHG